MRHGEYEPNRNPCPMDVERLVGANFRRLREDRGMSQETAAHNLGTDQAYISQLESGKRNPTIRTLYKLALAINVTPGELYSLEGIDPEIVGDPDVVLIPKSKHGRLSK